MSLLKKYNYCLLVFLILGMWLTEVHAQTQIFGSNTYQTFSSAGTTNGAATNGTMNLYSVVGQPLAISSATLSQTQAGILSAVSNGLLVSDVTPPSIAHTKPPNIKDDDQLTVKLDDGVSGVNATQSRIYYRKISQPKSSYQSATLTHSSGNDYTVTITNTMHDEMGIEYYFSTVDMKGNTNPMSGQIPTYYQVQLMNDEVQFGDQMPYHGSNPTNYGLISFPYDIAKNMGQIFTDAGIAILDKKSTARMYLFDSTAQEVKKEKEYAASPGDYSTIHRGAGYWLLMRDSHDNLALTNQLSPANTRDNLFVLHLHDQWTLIGNPYPMELDWNDVLQFDQNISSGASAKVAKKLQVYNGGWVDVTTLTKFRGAYVKVLGGPITLVIPFPSQTAIGGRSDYNGMPTSRNLADDAWVVPITLIENAAEQKAGGGFGMHPKAKLEEDVFDSSTPAAPFSTPELKFANVGKQSPLSTSMVTTAAKFTWDFEVSLTQKGNGEITWPTIEASGQELYLYDHTTFSLIDMTDATKYSFSSSSTKFTVYFGQNILNSIHPAELGIGVPYPNPMNDERSTSFNLALPDSPNSYNVRLQIFNSSGSMVSSSATTLPAGIHQFKNTLDEKIIQGIYFYRLAVSSTTTSKVSTGKIVIP